MITKTANDINEKRLKAIVDAHLRKYSKGNNPKPTIALKLRENLKSESIDEVIAKVEKTYGENSRLKQDITFALKQAGYTYTPKAKPAPQSAKTTTQGPSGGSYKSTARRSAKRGRRGASPLPYSSRRPPSFWTGKTPLAVLGLGALGAGAYFAYNKYNSNPRNWETEENDKQDRR